MSMPNFPKIDPEITRERAINMILASIAMEELSLSHIVNAESEKLKYVIEMLDKSETCGCGNRDMNDLLRVNQSISDVLQLVSENQILLKNKMDNALRASPGEFPPCPPCPPPCPPCPSGPTGPTGPRGPEGPKGEPGPAGPGCSCVHKCNAVFKGAHGAYKDMLWDSGSTLPWKNVSMSGKCVCLNSCDNSEIRLYSKGRFLINFSANVNGKSLCHCDIAVSMQMVNARRHSDLFTYKNHLSCADKPITISLNGIIADTAGCSGPSSIILKLVSPDDLWVEESLLTIIEI